MVKYTMSAMKVLKTKAEKAEEAKSRSTAGMSSAAEALLGLGVSPKAAAIPPPPQLQGLSSSSTNQQLHESTTSPTPSSTSSKRECPSLPVVAPPTCGDIGDGQTIPHGLMAGGTALLTRQQGTWSAFVHPSGEDILASHRRALAYTEDPSPAYKGPSPTISKASKKNFSWVVLQADQPEQPSSPQHSAPIDQVPSTMPNKKMRLYGGFSWKRI